MTDVEQKAREIYKRAAEFIISDSRPDGGMVGLMVRFAEQEIVAALRSAVAEEREECAKIPRRIAPSAGACINEIENAIRARGFINV